MNKDRQEKTYYAPNELAKLLMVSPVTVRYWANKGWIKAELTPGGHRRFSRREVERFARSRGISLDAQTGEGLRILIVDDEPDICSELSELLTEADPGVSTKSAYNGFEVGLSVVTFHANIVLLDLMMPQMDGFEVCRRLREDPATSQVRVIAMTGYHTEENRRRIIEAGAETCLRKPLDPVELFQAIGLSPDPAVENAGGP